jgi:hypothetical protein
MNVFGNILAKYLSAEIKGYEPSTPPDPMALMQVLRPADVILVEGSTRISSFIKYLTQSTWSHSALFVGDSLGRQEPGGEPHVIVEAELNGGVLTSPLSKYRNSHVRVVRPVGLVDEDRDKVIGFCIDRIGHRYDLKNVFDLARYLVPMPVPARYRRKLMAVGSGDPTRAICSTLIAQAFQSVRYPILPRVKSPDDDRKVKSVHARQEIMTIRHHSLYAPRDFDLSPYFAVVKPTCEKGFDYKAFLWGEERPVRVKTVISPAKPAP